MSRVIYSSNSEDWIRGLSWDIWAAGPRGEYKLAETLADLWWALPDLKDSKPRMRAFMKQECAKAMPDRLRREIEDFLAS